MVGPRAEGKHPVTGLGPLAGANVEVVGAEGDAPWHLVIERAKGDADGAIGRIVMAVDQRVGLDVAVLTIVAGYGRHRRLELALVPGTPFSWDSNLVLTLDYHTEFVMNITYIANLFFNP